MRAAAFVCSLLVFVFLGIGIYCSWIIGHAYAATIGEAFTFKRITFMFSDEFQHPHKTLLVGGLIFSIIMVIVLGTATLVTLGKLGQQAKAQQGK
jgi:hypothetical protein